MKRYKSYFNKIFKIKQTDLIKIKESTITFSNSEDARDAIANVIYFLSNKIGCDHPQFSMHICYALYSGVCSHLQDKGITDDIILQRKAKDTVQKILHQAKGFTI